MLMKSLEGLEEEVLGGSPGATTKRATHTGWAEGHDFSTVGKLENQAVPRALLVLKSRYLSSESGVRVLPPPLSVHKHTTSTKI